ncbi:MAG: hypothetical protein MUO68_06525 [Desulfobacteraceae bacterium]|nr:hypothetical protein [Desulfobacteraceae bacterium]
MEKNDHDFLIPPILEPNGSSKTRPGETLLISTALAYGTLRYMLSFLSSRLPPQQNEVYFCLTHITESLIEYSQKRDFCHLTKQENGDKMDVIFIE